MKKVISVLEILKVNTKFKDLGIPYYLKSNGSCGCQGLLLLSLGEKYAVEELCEIINETLFERFLKVKPGKVVEKGYELILF